MTWNTKPFIAFDLETTGPDPETARVVSAAVEGFPRTSAAPSVTWLVNPGVPIPSEASEIHGITTEHVEQHGLDAAYAVTQIGREIIGAFSAGIPVVAYNAAYDLTVLHRELLRHAPGLDGALVEAAKVVIDPRVIDKEKDRYRRGKRTLSDVCAHYGVEIFDAHNSVADALAAGNLALALAEKYPELTKVDTAYLHERQAVWYADQAQGLAQYWRNLADNQIGDPVDCQELRERADTINTHWPIIPVKEAL